METESELVASLRKLCEKYNWPGIHSVVTDDTFEVFCEELEGVTALPDEVLEEVEDVVTGLVGLVRARVLQEDTHNDNLALEFNGRIDYVRGAKTARLTGEVALKRWQSYSGEFKEST